MTTVVLVQAKPRIAATGATVDVRVAGGGSRAYDQLGFGDWRGGVATVPRMSAAIGFDAGGFTSRTLPSTASLRIFPSDKAYASYLGGLVWDKAAITVRMGDDETATTYPVVLAGTVSSAVSEGGAITLTVSDLSVSLDTPIASKTFAGTGDLEGGDDATGRVKRVAFGQVSNVEGFLLDKANSIYEFGDPSVQNAVTAISAVRDKGLAGPLVTVAWQGSAAATLTSLRNTAAPQGGAVIAPSIACVKWWTTPVGPLTADLTGRVAQNTRPANLAAMVAGQYATGITVANLAEAEAWAPYASGILISDSNETAAQAIDRLLNPLLMAWTVDGAGALTFRRFNLTAPTVTLTADTVKREVMFPPLRTRRVGFQRNNRVHSAAEISAAILATDVLFPDGTTGADLQITVGQILDTIDAIVSDGILSRGEKPPEIIRWQQSHDQLNALNQKYVTLGSPSDLTATRDSANASVSALDTYLGSLSPAWNDTTVDTPIDGPTYRQKWRDALSALEGFTAAITGRKGADGASITMTPPTFILRSTASGVDAPNQSLTMNVYRSNLPGLTRYTLYNGDNAFIADGIAADFAQNSQIYTTTGQDNLTLTPYGLSVVLSDHGGASGKVTWRAYVPGQAPSAATVIQRLADGQPGSNAPLVKTQWSINGVDNWHDNFFGADAYQRQSNDGGVTYGPAYRVVGEGGQTGADGTSPSIVFRRSATVPATPADNSGNPPNGWSDGPPAGTDFLWQTKATFRGATQLTSWSPPQRITGDQGPKGDKGDTVVGPQGPPPFGFVQDNNPGAGQFDRQTWYRPTSREYYYWLNGVWNKVGGDLFSQNLITSSAQIADAIIISAKIKDLEVDTIKVKNNAITGTVGQTNGSVTFSTQSVQFASVGINLYGGGMVRVDVGGIVTLGANAPAGTQALLTVAAGQTVLASGVKVSGQRGSPIGFSFLVARQDLGSGPLTFTASIGANNGYGSGDPHLIEYGTIFVSEFKK